MKNYNYRECWIIFLSFLIALLLQIISFSDNILIFKPSWILLMLFYWILTLPHRINICIGFTTGIILDLVSGSTLGIHSLAMSIIAYFIALNYHIIRSSMIWQQMLLIICLSFTMDIIVFWARFVETYVPFQSKIYWNSTINGVLWPLLSLSMNKIRRNYFLNTED